MKEAKLKKETDIKNAKRLRRFCKINEKAL
jgi:hypothetical protein